MKKLLIMVLVLGMVSAANAGIIDLVARGPGSMGHSGTIDDPLMESETIYIDIVLNHNAYYPGQTSNYDGYALYGMDLDIHVSGAGSLGHDTLKTGAPKLVWDSRFSVTGFSGIGGDGNIGSINGGSLTGNILGETVLVSGIFLHCDGPGEVFLDLTLNGTTKYSEFSIGGAGPYPGDWIDAVEGDLGDLVIYQPEPMTIALLGIGGLFLRRRK